MDTISWWFFATNFVVTIISHATFTRMIYNLSSLLSSRIFYDLRLHNDFNVASLNFALNCRANFQQSFPLHDSDETDLKSHPDNKRFVMRNGWKFQKKFRVRLKLFLQAYNLVIIFEAGVKEKRRKNCNWLKSIEYRLFCLRFCCWNWIARAKKRNRIQLTAHMKRGISCRMNHSMSIIDILCHWDSRASTLSPTAQTCRLIWILIPKTFRLISQYLLLQFSNNPSWVDSILKL